MNRIFPILAAVAVLLIVLAMGLGLAVGDLRSSPTPEALKLKTIHFLAGLTAALGVVLVESIVVTYFIGTSRWCREVCETYHLDRRLMDESARLKRRTFPLALGSMLVVVIVAALGAAADPAAALQSRPPGGWQWSQVHLAGALAGSAFIGWSLYATWMHIDRHRQIIADILAQVREIRLAKGLEV